MLTRSASSVIVTPPSAGTPDSTRKCDCRRPCQSEPAKACLMSCARNPNIMDTCRSSGGSGIPPTVAIVSIVHSNPYAPEVPSSSA